MDEQIRRAAIALHDRFTHEGMDRRAFMGELTRIAGGAAAANLLLSSIAAASQAPPQVPEGDPRLNTQTGSRELRPGRRYSGYAAVLQDARDDAPAVLVIHENRGLNEHIRDVTRRLALAGYFAVAPDFLSPAGGTPGDEDEARRMIGGLSLPEAVADGAAMIDHLRSDHGMPRKVGVIGFCWGGAMVHRIALAAGAHVGAGVSFYGPAPEPAEAARLQAPLLMILAERDQRVNASAEPYATAARAAGKQVRAITYPNVDHAFHNDTSGARYDPTAAQAAWEETLRFLNQHLG